MLDLQRISLRIYRFDSTYQKNQPKLNHKDAVRNFRLLHQSFVVSTCVLITSKVKLFISLSLLEPLVVERGHMDLLAPSPLTHWTKNYRTDQKLQAVSLEQAASPYSELTLNSLSANCLNRRFWANMVLV